MQLNVVAVLAIFWAFIGSEALSSVDGSEGRSVDQNPKQAKLRGVSLLDITKAKHHSVRVNALTQAQRSAATQRRMAQREQHYFSRLLVNLHRQALQKQRTHSRKVDMCNGNQYGWMVSIRTTCTDSFGDESVWDNGRAEGACRQAWDECLTDFSGQCCTQPEGPRNMQAYCATQNGTQDRACAVQGQMGGIQGNMGGIRDAVQLMDTRPPPALGATVFTVLSGDCRLAEGGRCLTSSGWPDGYENEDECEMKAPVRGVVHPGVKIVTRQFDTESCCDKLTIGDTVYSGDSASDGPDMEVEGSTPMSMKWETDYSGSSAGWKICAEDIVPAAPPPAPPPPPACWSSSAPGPGPGPSPGPFMVPCPSPGPAPQIPSGLSGPGPSPYPGWVAGAAGGRNGANGDGRTPSPAHPIARKLTKLEVQCQKLQDLVAKAARQIAAVRKWAEHDGIAGAGAAAPAGHHGSLMQMVAHVVSASSASGTSEAKDPDLTFAMQKVLGVGTQLDALRGASFCGAKRMSASAAGGAGAPAGAGGAGAPAGADADDGEGEGDDDYDDDDEDEDEERMEVNGTAVAALLEFDTEMEGAVTGFEKGVHPHGNKWWRYRYEYTLVESLVLFVSLMLLYWVMYILHGVSFFEKFKFYNVGLSSRLYRYAWSYFVFHSAALMVMVTLAYMLYMPWGPVNIFDICGKAFHEWVDGRANVPFLGYSWLLMALDVQFQLFVTFAIYSVFILFTTHNFAKALDDWKAIADNPYESKRLAVNDYHYNDFNAILIHRVKNDKRFQAAFHDLKLRCPGVDGVDQRRQDVNDFRLHLYLTDSLGKALEYLVEVSLKSIGFLAVSALIVAMLAHHYQVAFMYFLPVFIVIGILLFVIGYFLARDLRNHDHVQDLKNITVHTYCRMIQICLYCVFFSFSRLLLSSDIFTDYPKVYMCSFFGLLIVMFMAWWVAGEIMKATICAIVLPHESQEDRFKNNLQHVAYWYSTENCHECGARQAPANASISREWAGTKGSIEHGPPTDVPSGRDFSFR